MHARSATCLQIAKLLLAPFVCVVEIVWLRKRFPTPVLMCIGVVLVGVAIVTVSDVSVNVPGLVCAIVFVVCSGMQQVRAAVHLQHDASGGSADPCMHAPHSRVPADTQAG